MANDSKSIEEKFGEISLNYTPKPKGNCTLGDKIELSANHYMIELKKPILVFQYDVVISTLKEGEEKILEVKSVSRLLFQKLCEKYPNLRMFYDNMKLLYSMSPLSDNNELLETITLTNRTFTMKITKTSVLNINSKSSGDLAAIQALQLMFSEKLSQDFVPVMRSYFIRDMEKVNIGFNLNLWKGFYVSVRPSEMGFQLNVDVSNGVFFEDGKNLIELACEWYRCKETDLKGIANNDSNGVSFINSLKLKPIKTYLNIRKRIIDVGEVASTHRIEVNGEIITIQEYFQRKNIPLRFPSLRCLNLGKCRNYVNYLPIELAQTQLMHQKKLLPIQTSKVIKETAVPCNKRQRNIKHMISIANLNEAPLLKHNQIITEFEMSRLIGNVLSAPDLEYGLVKNQQRQKVQSNEIGRQGKWNNINKQFHTTASMINWLAISFGEKTHANELNNFIDSLMNTAYKHGLEVDYPLNSSNDFYYDSADIKKIRSDADAFNFFYEKIKEYENVKFIFVILPGATRLYRILKTFGDLTNGIITQAIDENTLKKQNGRYDRLASNVCMKINAKLGGKNFVLSQTTKLFQDNLQQLWAHDGSLMVFGADVNHAAPINNETVESIAAVVGSIDPNCCYYAARMQAQRQPEGQSLELISNLKTMVNELLLEFFKSNGKFPKRLVFLRDGVSDGQFNQILNHEMNEIRAACQMINNGYKPGITFIVVKKRHHTRLFPQNKKDSVDNGNVPPGTLVDSNIVTPNLFNFFLCSHMGIKGTSKPANYCVLHDDNNFTMNQATLLCHYLCHIYSKSTTSVSYPAPTYYADLCAERGRKYVRQSLASGVLSQNIELHNLCKNRMFFL